MLFFMNYSLQIWTKIILRKEMLSYNFFSDLMSLLYHVGVRDWDSWGKYRSFQSFDLYLLLCVRIFFGQLCETELLEGERRPPTVDDRKAWYNEPWDFLRYFFVFLFWLSCFQTSCNRICLIFMKDLNFCSGKHKFTTGQPQSVCLKWFF